MIIHTLKICTGDAGPDQSLFLFSSLRNRYVENSKVNNQMFLQCASTFVVIRFSHNETDIIMGRVKYKKQVICNISFL